MTDDPRYLFGYCDYRAVYESEGVTRIVDINTPKIKPFAMCSYCKRHHDKPECPGCGAPT